MTPFATSAPNGLPDDGPRDPELFTKFTLRGEPVTDLEPIRQNRLQHHLGHFVRKPRLASNLLEQRGEELLPPGFPRGQSIRVKDAPIIRNTVWHA